MASSREMDSINRQRIEWVRYWVDYMKKNPNEVWSKQQADFINSVMRSADVSPGNYMEIKKAIGKR